MNVNAMENTKENNVITILYRVRHPSIHQHIYYYTLMHPSIHAFMHQSSHLQTIVNNLVKD